VKQNFSRVLIAVILSGAIILLLAGLFRRSPPTTLSAYTNQEAAADTVSTQAPATTPVPTYLVYGLAIRATAAAIVPTLPTVSPIPRMEPTKQADFQLSDVWNRALDMAVAMNPPPPDDDPLHATTPVIRLTPVPTFPKSQRAVGGGILDDTPYQTGPPCDMVGPTNRWTKQVEGTRIRVCAGQIRNYQTSPGPGAILVEIWPANRPQPNPADVYQVPEQAGRIRITDVVGDVLTFQTNDGGLFYFDLAARQWVSPTPTPTP
jgi:hypothetical protein